MPLRFDLSLDAPYGEAVPLSPLVSRVLAPNPGIFTFRGTGVYIVGQGVGESQSPKKSAVTVIDPGPDLPEHRAALERVLAGRLVSHILVTHTHNDHSPAAAWLKAWSGAPTYGFGPHPFASDSVAKAVDAESGVEKNIAIEEGGDRAFMPDNFVRDGERITGEGFTFVAVHTPGHISNHLCFALEEEAALFCGDTVMGWSSSVIAPPDGDMAAYMASLERLLARGDRILYPTHGSPIQDPGPFIADYLAHRRAREAQVIECLEAGVDTIEAMVARIYVAVDPALHPAAALSLTAHLLKLEQEGRLVRRGDRFRLTDEAG